jgi:hypothetical protein
LTDFLYWYKSTNTDAEGAGRVVRQLCRSLAKPLIVFTKPLLAKPLIVFTKPLLAKPLIALTKPLLAKPLIALTKPLPAKPLIALTKPLPQIGKTAVCRARHALLAGLLPFDPLLPPVLSLLALLVQKYKYCL